MDTKYHEIDRRTLKTEYRHIRNKRWTLDRKEILFHQVHNLNFNKRKEWDEDDLGQREEPAATDINCLPHLPPLLLLLLPPLVGQWGIHLLPVDSSSHHLLFHIMSLKFQLLWRGWSIVNNAWWKVIPPRPPTWLQASAFLVTLQKYHLSQDDAGKDLSMHCNGWMPLF